MTSKALGQAIKTARHHLNFSLRDLAARVGVGASHLAHVEKGQRLPSIPLLRRIAETLGLDGQELLFLAYPDARELIGPSVRSLKARRGDVWRNFAANLQLHKQYNITREELKFLEGVSQLRQDSVSVHHLLFLLAAYRLDQSEE